MAPPAPQPPAPPPAPPRDQPTHTHAHAPAWPLERFEIHHPRITPALDGFTILHIADQHLRRIAPRTKAIERLIDAIAHVEVDLVAITGDLMNLPPDEDAAYASFLRLATAWRSRYGALAVPGNHDAPTLIQRLKHAAPHVRWLEHEIVTLPSTSTANSAPPLRVMGSGYPERVLEVMCTADDQREPPFTLALVHYPIEIFAASDLRGSARIDLMLAGHTHGGQIRLRADLAPHTSCDLPSHLASGLLRRGNTLLAISRGLGEAVLPLRINCGPHAPIYVLRQGPSFPPGTPTLSPVLRW